MSRPATLRSARDLSADKPHATRIKYMGGCRCMLCRAANSRYETARDAERRAGRKNDLVDAARARTHIRRLSHQGVGYKSVAKAARIATSVTFKIRSGERWRIRRNTEKLILAVGKEAARGTTNIDARPTWKLIGRLLREGFTKCSLAQRLGYGMALQLDEDTITVKNAQKVKALYDTLMVGG